MIVLVRYEYVPFRVLILHACMLFSLLVPLSVLSFMSINSLLLGHLLPCSLPPSLSVWFLLYDPIPHLFCRSSKISSVLSHPSNLE